MGDKQTMKVYIKPRHLICNISNNIDGNWTWTDCMDFLCDSWMDVIDNQYCYDMLVNYKMYEDDDEIYSSIHKSWCWTEYEYQKIKYLENIK